MKPSNLLLAAAALAALALSACDDRPSRSDEEREPVQIEQVPPPVEQPPAPAPEVRDPAPTPPPTDRLPPEERSSEQSVQPESETLFY
ncbi:hypothetical protein SH203_00751 [Brevundimonas sp. SH203]|uniref:hypothetical protein n=1 Tax=Brevundimonas sp. SH203 TaxID=345167 RepID=UPI0009C5C1C7|nr:hypothetical protein [Brevundimonas sp. SH203]GAW40353.1 hypothetical protein SH203_00751 [Brevundimonas sp. SH203]